MILGFIQNIGPWQLVICVVVAFVLFGGAKKIPELAKSLGRAKNEFKKGLAEGEKEEGADHDNADNAPSIHRMELAHISVGVVGG